jgi:hypothetical protein
MDDTESTEEDRGEYSLGEKAQVVYDRLTGARSAVTDMARRMAELTLPFAFPPLGYMPGDDLPGNNQSVGAQCVNTLVSKLVAVALPDGQPAMKLKAVEYLMADEIRQDPERWTMVVASLKRLAIAHTEMFQAILLASAYIEYLRQLLIAGNCLWKHLKHRAPRAIRCDYYVVKRNKEGIPLLIIHKECVNVQGLSKEHLEFIKSKDESKELFADGKAEWEQEVDIYCCQKLLADGDGEGEDALSYAYWEEWEGHMLPGSSVETDFATPVMHAGWLVKIDEKDWSPSYCEMYRGDLYSVEAHASALNDIDAAAAFSLFFVKPGSATSIKQFREADNLAALPGDAADITMLRSDKNGDASIASTGMEAISRRLSAAFLLQSSVQRSGERVTAEEIKRMGQELDKALGGLYTQIAQGNQRTIIMRAMRLNEDANPKLWQLDKDLVKVSVITGLDALGDDLAAQDLLEWGEAMTKLFSTEGIKQLDVNGFGETLAAFKGIKVTGILKPKAQVAQEDTANQQRAVSAQLIDKATGPGIKAMADMAQNGGGGAAAPAPTQTLQ